jgi:hypothetical protein
VFVLCSDFCFFCFVFLCSVFFCVLIFSFFVFQSLSRKPVTANKIPD